MKKMLSLLLLVIFLFSCGPKRMGCGARGICETSKKKSKLTAKFIPASYLYVGHDNLINTEYRPILD
jgi:hypothetical protein